MNNILRTIELDLYSPTSYEVIKAQQGDKNSRIIEFILYDQGEPYEFTNNIFFRFVGHRGDGSSFTKTEEECIVRNGNHIKVTLLEDILYYAGIIEAKLVMYELDEKKYEKTILSTIPFKISCIKNPCNENELTAGEYSIVTDLIFQMKEFSKNAQDIIDTAAESAVKAKASENNAKASETKAKASETNAKNSEVNAANSASAAKTSETNAKISEDAAKTSETNAANSKNAAATSAANATTSATSAALSATTATQKATDADTSAINAANSATSAANSATTAINKANAAAASATNATSSEITATTKANAASASANNAAASATSADAHAKQAQSYAIGTGNVRPNEATDNAKYYYEQSKDIYENFESAGNVTGVKGENESTFRTGNVNLTPENIGAPSNEYMEEHFVPDYVSQSYGAVVSSGWYRIAQLDGGLMFADSCVVSIKRFYNSPAPEYQKVQFVNSYRSNKIIPIVSFTGSDGVHMFTKIRKVYDSVNSILYIEIYQDRDTVGNSIIVNITDAVGYNFRSWKTIEPVPTQETVEGVNVLASLDLPANFDISMLLEKSGGEMNGIIDFINNGGIRFTAPALAETARGIDFLDKSGNRIGGTGIHAKNGIPDFIYASLGGNNSHNPDTGLAIYADKMKWKNSAIITEKWDFLGRIYEKGNSFSYDTSAKDYSEYSIISYDGEYFDEFSFHHNLLLDSFYSYEYGADSFNIKHDIDSGDFILISLNGNILKFVNNTANRIARIYAR